jgi:hypothetical protein
MSRFDSEDTIEFRKKNNRQRWGEGWRANNDVINTHVKVTKINDAFQSIREMRNNSSPKQKQQQQQDELPERPIRPIARFPNGSTLALKDTMTSFTQRRKRLTE